MSERDAEEGAEPRSPPAFDADVLVVGAGPAGLTLANILGGFGLSVIVIERGTQIVDYPRAVSVDDESLRVFQSIGLVERILPHTIPDQWIRYVTRRGRLFASVEPRRRDLGWPRRNAFIQPEVDRVLLEGLSRFTGVSVRFGHELESLQQDSDGVVARVRVADRTIALRTRFLVGCDGGRSTTRKLLGLRFDGQTESTRWLVVDIRNDPLGIPDAYLFCDPLRPHVSIALPHGMRRLEFLVFDHETDQELLSDEGMRALLSLVLPAEATSEIVRARVYTHHARLAERFVVSRVLVAGDAAHLMPVWQGQGFNSGVRDASNLGWKIAGIVGGSFARDLLDTYDCERRPHAAAMISLSVLVGRIFSPTSRVLAAVRDALTWLLSALPGVKAYILQMKFKPMPIYAAGALVPQTRARKIKVPSAVGRMFPQPMIRDAEGQLRRFDDMVGDWFAIVSYGLDPRAHMSGSTLSAWRELGTRFVAIVAPTQLDSFSRPQAEDDLLVVVDQDTVCKDWFGDHQVAVVVLRPDRFVAAAGPAGAMDELTRAFATAAFRPTDLAERSPLASCLGDRTVLA